MDQRALQKLTYGLYLLTTENEGKANGCIINTACQVAYNPNLISVAVTKTNLSCDNILKTGKFNLSFITESAPFTLFENFGFKSGRETNKFADCKAIIKSANGLYYLTKFTNGFISVKVTNVVDVGSHTLFIGEVEDGEVFSDENPCTYAHYLNDIKPKPVSNKKVQWVCNVCGYSYEGEDLPDDFICPLCKHPKSDFEKIEF